ncbi:MAG: hypothetical protein BGO39_18350 [Chloroflexi bacterium 54-19]|nr:MAG: hypothetical protein BGO39_18350 [Chloroflexi bacterium 54-19]
MAIKLIGNDYQEGDYPALENLTVPPSTWSELKAGVVEWLKSDWKYAGFLVGLIVLARLSNLWK